jgi:hypothetical protein
MTSAELFRTVLDEVFGATWLLALVRRLSASPRVRPTGRNT